MRCGKGDWPATYVAARRANRREAAVRQPRLVRGGYTPTPAYHLFLAWNSWRVQTPGGWFLLCRMAAAQAVALERSVV